MAEDRVMSIVISNLRYAADDRSIIDMDVSGVFEGETIQFTYNPEDAAVLTQTIRQLLDSGDYKIADYVTSITEDNI